PQAGAVLIQALTAREALHQRAPRKATGDGPAGPQLVDGPAGPQYVDGPAEPRYQDGTPEAPTIEQQEADALALIAETALHHGIDPVSASGVRCEPRRDAPR